MDNSKTVTFHSWARLWVAHLTFQVPSNCRAVCTTIKRFRVCAVSCPYLITTSASHWTRRPLTPFIITSWNCKMKKNLRFGSLCILGSIQVNVYKLKPWYFFFWKDHDFRRRPDQFGILNLMLKCSEECPVHSTVDKVLWLWSRPGQTSLLNVFYIYYCIPGEGHMGSGFPPAGAIKRKRKWRKN